MVSYIDRKLIGTTQWIVRQFELYSPITRDRIMTIIHRLFYAMVAAWYVLAISVSPAHLIMMLVFSSPFLWGTASQRRAMKKVPAHAYPLAIKDRTLWRITLTGITLFIAACIVRATQILPSETPVRTQILIGFTIFVLPMALVILDEYVLCSKSLSPQERELRKTHTRAKETS